MLNFLIARDKEEPYLDFKETLSIAKQSPFPKIAKDIMAFANYGGGFILLGYRENERSETPDIEREVSPASFVPLGLPDRFHIDQADLQAKLNSYSSIPLELGYRKYYREVNSSTRKFAAVYVPPSTGVVAELNGQHAKVER